VSRVTGTPELGWFLHQLEDELQIEMDSYGDA
jgi:hypothetical protein